MPNKLRSNARTKSEAAARYYYRMYATSAKMRGYAYELTFEQFTALIKQPCYYCGRFENIVKVYVRRKKANFRANGVDRFDNSIGYTVANAVPCCTFCNYDKRRTHGQQYIDKCKRLALNHGCILAKIRD